MVFRLLNEVLRGMLLSCRNICKIRFIRCEVYSAMHAFASDTVTVHVNVNVNRSDSDDVSIV